MEISTMKIVLITIAAFIAGFIINLVVLPFVYQPVNYKLPSLNLPFIKPGPSGSQVNRVVRFESEQDFKNYLEEVSAMAMDGGFGMGMARSMAMPVPIGAPTLDFAQEIGEESVWKTDESYRVSETNVQVTGIDEPDIVKTDGKEIYFSSQGFFPRPILEEPISIEREMMIRPYPDYQSGTRTIKAFPPADLKVDGTIDKYGTLLLADNILIVFEYGGLYAYDVSDPSSPAEVWKSEFQNNTRMVSARLYNDLIYLITSTGIAHGKPCPIVPLEIGGSPIRIPCGNIYHPITPVAVDITYNVMMLDPKSGDVKQTASFVGSSGQSVVYMSGNAVYVTYNFTTDIATFMYNFLSETASDLMPADLLNRLEKLAQYDISSAAKLTELGIILEQFTNSLDDDERLRIENELENRMDDYLEKNIREFAKMGIVKIGTDDLKIKATGSVPGTPLNQFSLDEYEGNLRVATTIGGGFFFTGTATSENDVYILNENLTIAGSVEGLGLTERIYSVRFVEDKGYVVTFRQIDPFYVLDLAIPTNPKLSGELKIPGFSSYLHPITKDMVLGIGREESQVKLSLFDVSSPENPTEKDKYMLSEYWSDVEETHHAFLLDQDNEIFFLPAGGKGFIFSYSNNELELTKAISNMNAKRALYINDYLYIIGDSKIVVLNESDWEKVNELEFEF